MTRRSSVGDICLKLGTLSSVASLQKHFLHGQCAAGSLQVRIKKLLELDLRSDLCAGASLSRPGPPMTNSAQ